MLTGCTQSKISFERDSAFGSFLDNVQQPAKPQVKRSSGLVIYKDDNRPAPAASSGSSSDSMNFDLPIKF